LIATQNEFFGNFQQKKFKLKISTCYSSPIFCANVLLHGTSFDSRSSLVGNMALTIGIPSGVEKQGLFFRFIAYTKPKTGGRNLLATHCNYL
jgi:hypothetical protein